MDRAKVLRKLGSDRNEEQMKKQVGSVKELLLLKKRGLVQSGLSRDYWNIYFDEPLQNQAGELVQVKVTGWQDGGMQSTGGFLSGQII